MRRAFTLIELLVVISIIALLIAILLPILSSAGESSRRVECASNVKSLATATVNYAVANDGDLLVGYSDNKKQSCYFIRRANRNWGEMGWLWDAGYIEDPRWQFCPSNETNPFRAFDTDINPWPPDNSPSSLPVRSGYNQRPLVHYKLSTGKPMNGYVPSIEEVGNVALYSDPNQHQNATRGLHEDGINVSYIDGSAQYVAAIEYEDNLDGVSSLFNPAHNNKLLSDDGQSGVWADLDRAQ